MLGVFILIYLVCSSLVWKIDIKGNKKVETEYILSLLRECKVKVGTYKEKISKGKIVDYIRSKVYDIAWVGIDIKGTTMYVTIEEKIISTEQDRKEVGDIIAKKSGVITKIIAENGTAKYITGSYVEKGSVLIEGKIYSEIIDEVSVHASGIVRGIVDYKFEQIYKYKKEIKEKIGKSTFGVGVGINNKEFILKCLPKKYKYDINNKVSMFNFFGINISFIFRIYEKYILKDIVNTKENLIKQGEIHSNLFLNQLLISDSKVKDKKVEITETDEGIIYKLTVSIEENIGEFLKTGDK
jgi:similar to stage IV sporulation protein